MSVPVILRLFANSSRSEIILPNDSNDSITQ